MTLAGFHTCTVVRLTMVVSDTDQLRRVVLSKRVIMILRVTQTTGSVLTVARPDDRGRAAARHRPARARARARARRSSAAVIAGTAAAIDRFPTRQLHGQDDDGRSAGRQGAEQTRTKARIHDARGHV